MAYRTYLYFSLVLLSFGVILKNSYKLTSGKNSDYVTAYHEVPLDHFNSESNVSFKIRYIYNDAYWKKPYGPIFFANQGPSDSINNFSRKSFMWEIAEEFGAMVVITEHRFYGESFPKNYSYDFHNNDSVIRYLTTEQTLEDSASLITQIKESYSAQSSPVIIFGCGYNGILVTYFRMKYPHIVTGALASSARLIVSKEKCGLKGKALWKIFSKDYSNCGDIIRQTWAALENTASTLEGRNWLKESWNLCYQLSPELSFKNLGLNHYLSSMYTVLGNNNYPFPTSFYKDLPAFPVKKFCRKLTANGTLGLNETDKAILANLYEGVNMFYNYTGQKECFDQYDFSGHSISLKTQGSLFFQACNELNFDVCLDGVHDFFFPMPLEVMPETVYCGHGVTTKPGKFERVFGVENLLQASYILFSNGKADPWYGYGVQQNLSDTLLAINIEDATHCADLVPSNPADPLSVVNAREYEKQVIREWIRQYNEGKYNN